MDMEKYITSTLLNDITNQVVDDLKTAYNSTVLQTQVSEYTIAIPPVFPETEAGSITVPVFSATTITQYPYNTVADYSGCPEKDLSATSAMPGPTTMSAFDDDGSIVILNNLSISECMIAATVNGVIKKLLNDNKLLSSSGTFSGTDSWPSVSANYYTSAQSNNLFAPLITGVSANYIPVAISTSAWANSPLYVDPITKFVGIGSLPSSPLHVAMDGAQFATTDMYLNAIFQNAAKTSGIKLGYNAVSNRGVVMAANTDGGLSFVVNSAGEAFRLGSDMGATLWGTLQLLAVNEGGTQILTYDVESKIVTRRTFDETRSDIGAAPALSLTQNYIPVCNNAGGTTLGNSVIQQASSMIGIGISPSENLEILGTNDSKIRLLANAATAISQVSLMSLDGISCIFGQEGSAGARIIPGTAAYSGVVTTVGAPGYPLHFGTNNAVRNTIDGAGNHTVLFPDHTGATAFNWYDTICTANIASLLSNGNFSTIGTVTIGGLAGSAGYLPLIGTGGLIGASNIYQDGTGKIGIGLNHPTDCLDMINGSGAGVIQRASSVTGYPFIEMYRGTTSLIGLIQAGVNKTDTDSGDYLWFGNPIATTGGMVFFVGGSSAGNECLKLYPSAAGGTVSINSIDITPVAEYDYFSSSSIGGGTGATGHIAIAKIGKRVDVSFAISETSTGGFFTFTLPFANSSLMDRTVIIYTVDATINAGIGYGTLPAGSSTFSGQPSATGTWTTGSTTKQMKGQFTYYTA